MPSSTAYRSPLELACYAADVDRLNNGRVIVGLCAGDNEREFTQRGVSMPSSRATKILVDRGMDVTSGARSLRPAY
jgi:alkanesulfonate monooxygenase SsuD/methylene tetrahydromethanopterin reductase-like flavin-dependent oxidoreductase (luciferase family)